MSSVPLCSAFSVQLSGLFNEQEINVKSIKTNSKLLFSDQADIPVDSLSKFDIKAFAVLFVYFIKLHADIEVVKNDVELLILNLKCSKRRETQSLPLTKGKHC